MGRQGAYFELAITILATMNNTVEGFMKTVVHGLGHEMYGLDERREG